MARFFMAGTNLLGGTAIIRGKDAEHIRVLRLKPGEEVEVEQVTSDFQVGCNMFNFGQLGKSEWDAQYRATWEKGGLFKDGVIELEAEGVDAPTGVRYLRTPPYVGSVYGGTCLPLGTFEMEVR